MIISLYEFTAGPVSINLEFFPVNVDFPVSFSPAERNMEFRLKDSDSWANSPGFKSGWVRLLPSGDFDNLFPDDEELEHPLTPKIEVSPFQSHLINWTARSAIYP